MKLRSCPSFSACYACWSTGRKIGKRQVKAPKIYLRDSGILHALLNLPDFQTLHGYPRVGASWEGFAIEQILRILKPPQAFFWATHSGAEIDLFFIFHGRRYGIECKFSEPPKITKSMNQALESLDLAHLWIIPESILIPFQSRYLSGL